MRADQRPSFGDAAPRRRGQPLGSSPTERKRERENLPKRVQCCEPRHERRVSCPVRRFAGPYQQGQGAVQAADGAIQKLCQRTHRSKSRAHLLGSERFNEDCHMVTHRIDSIGGFPARTRDACPNCRGRRGSAASKQAGCLSPSRSSGRHSGSRLPRGTGSGRYCGCLTRLSERFDAIMGGTGLTLLRSFRVKGRPGRRGSAVQEVKKIGLKVFRILRNISSVDAGSTDVATSGTPLTISMSRRGSRRSTSGLLAGSIRGALSWSPRGLFQFGAEH